MYKSPRYPQHNDVFVQPEDGSAKVWRYLTLPKLLYILERRALVLPRLDLLKDPYEGTTTHAYRRYIIEITKRERRTPSAAFMKNLKEEPWPKHIHKSLYVSSWHLNDHESEAMWQLYCGSHEGVALQTTYEKLDAAIPLTRGLFLGLVRYLDYERDVYKFSDPLIPVMHKRNVF